MAAPDHGTRQCIQGSALFPGRADGGTEGRSRARREALERQGREGMVWGIPIMGLRGLCGAMPPKIFQKLTLKLPISAYLQTEMVSSAVSARLSIRPIGIIASSYLYGPIDRCSKC